MLQALEYQMVHQTMIVAQETYRPAFASSVYQA